MLLLIVTEIVQSRVLHGDWEDGNPVGFPSGWKLMSQDQVRLGKISWDYCRNIALLWCVSSNKK